MQLRSVVLRKPAGYVSASMLCSFGGFLFGIDTGIIGPVTVMKNFTSYAGHPSPTVHGLIVSSILIPAAISSFFAGRLADALGRHWGIAIGAFIYGLGAALEAAAMHIAMFIVGRVVQGIGEGLYLGTLVVYICEISPPRYRGPLTSGPQLLITFGLVVGFFTCYGTANMDSTFSWRLPYILLAAYSFAFAAAVLLWLPASPRWLTLRGRTKEASEAWEKLDVPAAEREKILTEYGAVVAETTNAGESDPDHANSAAEHQHVIKPKKAKAAAILELFDSNARPRLFLAVFLMGMQQLSGIDGVLYYAPILFKQAGLSSTESTFLASGVSAIVIFAVSIPALIYADRWGRRANTILGGVGMGATMFLMGGLHAGGAVRASGGAGRWVVIASIYVFAFLFSVSWAFCVKIYAAEIQPQRTRATAVGIAHGSNWLTNFLVALVTPQLLAQSTYGAYFLFGSCTLATALVCWAFMPETRGRSLDDIEEAFHGSKVPGGLRDLAKTLRRKISRSRPAVMEA